MSADSGIESAAMPVAAYKRILQQVLDRRPSGMRQRLAEALGKNRSFISQISNPGYATPIPVQHVERIFEICHFSKEEKKLFLAAYRRAHPRRLQGNGQGEGNPARRVTVTLPDLGDAQKNRKLDALIADFATLAGKLLRDD
ncbi:MAG TPA: hypothetical protein VL331_04210 [Croceibacterium sp.]|jgi:hypothetical protein|nr:hypothetical protein [Croceibacterium sp.]